MERLRGEYRTRPNNLRRAGALIHRYRPPEPVRSGAPGWTGGSGAGQRGAGARQKGGHRET